MKGASSEERQILHLKYKKLRNKVNCKIRNDNRIFNNERINKAKDENEEWKIAKEITNPRKENDWTMKNDDGTKTIDEQLVLI